MQVNIIYKDHYREHQHFSTNFSLRQLMTNYNNQIAIDLIYCSSAYIIFLMVNRNLFLKKNLNNIFLFIASFGETKACSLLKYSTIQIFNMTEYWFLQSIVCMRDKDRRVEEPFPVNPNKHLQNSWKKKKSWKSPNSQWACHKFQ